LHPQDVGDVLRAGARGVAVLSGIFAAADAGAAAERYLAALAAPENGA
jgi:thiamine monophosphate synthase